MEPLSDRSIEAAIVLGDRILLDTSVLLSYLNGSEKVSPIATDILDKFVRAGRNEAIVSMVSVMEVLVRPLRQSVEISNQVVDFLQNFPNLQVLDINFAVAQEAARLRANYTFASPDALIIATGFVARVRSLVTNDAAWQSRMSPFSERVSVCYLNDYVSS